MKEVYVFDLDGTLVDSMPNYSKAILSILDEAEIPYADDLIKTLTVLGNTKSAELYVKMGVQDTVGNIVSRIEQKLIYEYENTIFTKVGVKEYLQKLREEEARLFVLTASPHITTDACLRHNGIFDWFETVWSVEDFQLTKSDTRLFEVVAKRIGCQPNEIHYFDDNLIALQNAKTAGYETYGVYDMQSADEVDIMKQNYHFVGSFADLV